MLEELKTLIAVVECENFTRAGELRHLSQPSVSVHIKNLENEFGVTLVMRSQKQRKLLITEEGMLLYRKGKEILKSLEEVKQELLGEGQHVGGKLRIGASHTIGECFLTVFLGDFMRMYPDIHIELIIDNSSKICEEVEKLRLEIGLIEAAPDQVVLVQEHFFRDELILIFPPGTILEGTSLTEILSGQNKWVARERGSGTRTYLEYLWNEHQIIPETILTLGSNYAVKEAVKNGLGASVVSHLVVNTPCDNVQMYSLGERYQRYFSAIYPEDMSLSRAARAFLEALQQHTTR
ncbi:MAG: LysR substrate-binding domain-containing protein [Cellulosilyticaceae bacterium]